MDSKATNQTKAYLLALKGKLFCLKDIQADIQRRIEAVQKEADEIAEIIRQKEAKPEQAGKEVGANV